MGLKLNGATSGSVELDVPAVVSGGDITFTLPDSAGSDGQVIQTNGSGVFTFTHVVPPGAVIYTTQNTAPTGYIKANGATISRTTYANLFAVIGTTFGAGDGSTTFVIPDLRGEFLRAWDDGRGIDSGRNFGSAQAAQVLDHTHTLRYNNTSNSNDYGNGGNYLTAKSVGLTRISNAGVNARTGSMINNTGGTEGYPRNIALLACIKF